MPSHGVKEGALSTKALLIDQLTRALMFVPVLLPKVLYSFCVQCSLECTKQKRFPSYIICMKYSIITAGFQPNQSTASTADNPQRNIISLVSLAIVQLGLEVLIVFDYHFLCHFCHVWKTVIGWWDSPLGDAICQFLFWEIFRNVMRLPGKEYLKTDLIPCCLSLWLSMPASFHSLVIPAVISSQGASKLLCLTDEPYWNV